MKSKDLINVRDCSIAEAKQLLRETKKLKAERKKGSNVLKGKTLGLLFYKPSLRTRVSFEVGMQELGGKSLYIGPVEMEGGKRESAHDLGHVLSRYLDGIVARTFEHSDVLDLAKYANIPVINGLSDHSHPCQAFADLFTVQEHFGKLKGIQMTYLGDGNNVCLSLIEACVLLGTHLNIATPKKYTPGKAILQWAKEHAPKTGAKINVTTKPAEAVKNTQVVYTDVWTSMGQEKEKSQRKKNFSPFQVNAKLMQLASKDARFMHCLPAHRGEEVTAEVIDSEQSIVFDQAENRLHVQKGILKTLLK